MKRKKRERMGFSFRPAAVRTSTIGQLPLFRESDSGGEGYFSALPLFCFSSSSQQQHYVCQPFSRVEEKTMGGQTGTVKLKQKNSVGIFTIAIIRGSLVC